MHPFDCNCEITKTNVTYKILMIEDYFYELMFEKDLTEGQIIKNIIWIPIINSPDEIIMRLKYLYACIEFGNCMRVRAALPSILDALEDLYQRTFFREVSSTVLQLIEQIMLTKELTTSWLPLFKKIFKILLRGFKFDGKPTSKLLITLKNVVCVLPIEQTMNIIRGYMVTDYEDLKQHDRLLYSLKLISELATQRGDELSPRQVRRVRGILVILTQDECALVSTISVHTLVDLYVNTRICEKKSRIQQELLEIIPSSVHLELWEYYEQMHFFFCEPETPMPEPPEYSARNESEIIKIFCNIKDNTPIDERKLALIDFGECMAYENCNLAIIHFRKIIHMLLKLLYYAETSTEFNMVLDVIEKMFRCRPMIPYWTEYYREILLRIILSYDIDKETMDAIDLFIQNIADTLPVTRTVKIVDTLIATADYPYNLCAMKILGEVAGQHKLFSKTNLDSLLHTVVRSIDDPEKNIRLAAECVIFKLCAKLGEQRIALAIDKNKEMNRRLRILLNKGQRKYSI